MKLDRVSLAKIAADYIGWADPDEAAKSAEKGEISIQMPCLIPANRVGFYGIEEGQKVLPIDQLADIDYVQFLIIALPEEAVIPDIMDLLRSIEIEREKKINPRSSSESESTDCSIFGTEIDLVVETGEDPLTGEKRYDCMPDSGIIGDNIDADRVRDFKTHMRGHTLSEIDNRTKRAIKGNVPPEKRNETR